MGTRGQWSLPGGVEVRQIAKDDAGREAAAAALARALHHSFFFFFVEAS